MLNHPSISQAVAFAVPHPTLGEDVAVAIVLHEGCTVSTQELRQFTASHLADFKVPRQIIFLQEIPKGPTGKIQRIGLAKKLKADLDALGSHDTDSPTSPASPLEAEISTIWQEVLGVEKISLLDDFLFLGGNSIQASIILLTINERYGAGLLIKDFFSASTISSLADIIQKKITPSK